LLLQKSKKKKKKPARKPVVCQSEVDGTTGPVPDGDQEELDPYSKELDKLSVPVEDTGHDDQLLPTQTELESLPWD